MAGQGGDVIYRSAEQPCGLDYSAACFDAACAFSSALRASFDVFQNRAEMFVLGNRGVGHTLLVFVEHGVGDRNAF